MIDLSNEEWREAYRLVREAAAAPGDDAARVAAFDFLRTAESKRLLAIAHLLQPGATERSIQAALVPLERVDRRAKVTDAEMGIRTTDVPACADRAPYVVVADNVRSAFNMGGIFRTADFFGAERLVLCGYSPTPENPQVKKTALGADETTPWTHVNDVRDAVDALRAEGRRTRRPDRPHPRGNPVRPDLRTAEGDRLSRTDRRELPETSRIPRESREIPAHITEPDKHHYGRGKERQREKQQ